MNVLAVVVAGGSRSPGAPDALTLVGGVPMVVRAVRAVLTSGVVDRVALRGERVHELVHACAGLPVEAWQSTAHDVAAQHVGADHVGAHTGQRPDATNGDDPIAERIVVLHEAARPLTPPALFRVVLDAVRAGHRAVVPVLPLTDTVKMMDAAGLLRATPDRSGLRVVQAPHAFRASDVHFGPVAAGAHAVPGDPLAFAVRTPWDLEMAELLLEEGP